MLRSVEVKQQVEADSWTLVDAIYQRDPGTGCVFLRAHLGDPGLDIREEQANATSRGQNHE
jgi:hypothetical protein